MSNYLLPHTLPYVREGPFGARVARLPLAASAITHTDDTRDTIEIIAARRVRWRGVKHPPRMCDEVYHVYTLYPRGNLIAPCYLFFRSSPQAPIDTARSTSSRFRRPALPPSTVFRPLHGIGFTLLVHVAVPLLFGADKAHTAPCRLTTGLGRYLGSTAGTTPSNRLLSAHALL